MFNPGDSFDESVTILNEGESGKVLQNEPVGTKDASEEGIKNHEESKNSIANNNVPKAPTTLETPTLSEPIIETTSPNIKAAAPTPVPHHMRQQDILLEPELNTGCGF